MISKPLYQPAPRFVWPDGARCAVMLCFDVDGETTALAEDRALAKRRTTMSQCRYGPEVGVPRFLELLAHYELKGTFFIPSAIVEWHPRMTAAVLEAGHELGAHGHLHEKLVDLSPDEERAVLEKSLAILEQASGRRPAGYRAPWFELNEGTPDLLVEFGFSYSASEMGDDVPYHHANGLVEIPGQWLLEDWEQFAFNADPAWGFVPENPEKVFDLWWSEFEAMLDFGSCFVLTLHPWLSGRPSRVRLLERLIRGMQETGGAWFATGEEIARWAREQPDARREIDFDHS